MTLRLNQVIQRLHKAKHPDIFINEKFYLGRSLDLFSELGGGFRYIASLLNKNVSIRLPKTKSLINLKQIDTNIIPIFKNQKEELIYIVDFDLDQEIKLFEFLSHNSKQYNSLFTHTLNQLRKAKFFLEDKRLKKAGRVKFYIAKASKISKHNMLKIFDSGFYYPDTKKDFVIFPYHEYINFNLSLLKLNKQEKIIKLLSKSNKSYKKELQRVGFKKCVAMLHFKDDLANYELAKILTEINLESDTKKVNFEKNIVSLIFVILSLLFALITFDVTLLMISFTALAIFFTVKLITSFWV